MLAAFLDDLTSNLYAIRKSQTIKIGLGVNQMSQESNDVAELLITLTADIVAAHVSNNSVSVDDVPRLISNVYSALSGLGGVSAATSANSVSRIADNMPSCTPSTICALGLSWISPIRKLRRSASAPLSHASAFVQGAPCRRIPHDDRIALGSSEARHRRDRQPVPT